MTEREMNEVRYALFQLHTGLRNTPFPGTDHGDRMQRAIDALERLGGEHPGQCWTAEEILRNEG